MSKRQDLTLHPTPHTHTRSFRALPATEDQATSSPLTPHPMQSLWNKQHVLPQKTVKATLETLGLSKTDGDFIGERKKLPKSSQLSFPSQTRRVPAAHPPVCCCSQQVQVPRSNAEHHMQAGGPWHTGRRGQATRGGDTKAHGAQSCGRPLAKASTQSSSTGTTWVCMSPARA